METPAASPKPLLSRPEAASGISRWLPGLATLGEYHLSWLRHDIVAGIVLTTMLVPVGIAYAVASGLPGVYGLYATIIPLIAYAVFGPSPIAPGLFCILAGVLKLGFITELLSKPIRYGYMNGIALMVLISQLPKLLGFSIEGDGPLRSLIEIGSAAWAGKIN